MMIIDRENRNKPAVQYEIRSNTHYKMKGGSTEKIRTRWEMKKTNGYLNKI